MIKWDRGFFALFFCFAFFAGMTFLFGCSGNGGGSDDDDSADDDSGPTLTCYEDADADTYGNPLVNEEFEGENCPDGWVKDNTDCDDTNPNVYPGAVEGPEKKGSCFDGLDNDCNGAKDELDDKCYLITFGTCSDEPPAGVELPAPLPEYSGGSCPQLSSGMNTIISGGVTREFLIVAPEDLEPTENLPVIFMWYWLAGDAYDFLKKSDAQTAVNKMRFLAVIPEKKGDLLFTWPFLLIDSKKRLNEELLFFDDMLTCLGEQYNLNLNCVGTVGVSSGGTWTTYLAHQRSQYLASFLSLSGGAGHPDNILNPVQYWQHAVHKLPAIVLWGGPGDWCGLSFATLSNYLEDYLEEDGHFFVECIHNCQHAEPPAEGDPITKYAFLWNFVFDHPYWLEDGKSSYVVNGLPEGFPEWCGIGDDSAEIRVGECEHGPFGQCF